MAKFRKKPVEIEAIQEKLTTQEINSNYAINQNQIITSKNAHSLLQDSFK